VITFLALSPSVDVTYLVDEFREGCTHRPTSVFRAAGGKALNAARAATLLGARVKAIAILGGSAGDFIRRDLEASGVPVEAIAGTLETRTCVSVSSAESGLLTEVYESPTPISAGELASVRDAVATALADRPGWLAISGGVPASVPDAELGDLVRLAHSLGRRVAIDSHGPALAGALTAGPDLVKVNRREATELLGLPVGTEAFDLAARIHYRTGGTVIVTDGVDGSVAVDATARWRATLAGEPGRYAVGSGDSFLGGLLAALDGGFVPGDASGGRSAGAPIGAPGSAVIGVPGSALVGALRLATGCATANALVPGAARFAASDAREIAARVVVSAE
jgi:1-phosphofructokinase family hexose kinase